MNDDLQKDLAGVRTEIDSIDTELLRLLNQRARCAQKVGEIKAAHGEAGHIYRPEREAQVLRRLQDANPGPLPSENITFFSAKSCRPACHLMMFFAKSNPATPITPSCRWKTPPKAQSVDRWICCWQRH